MGDSRFFFPLLPLLKEAAAVPILDSILDHEKSALKYLSFPKMWQQDQHPLLSQFLVRYNRFLNRRGLACSHNDPPCDSTCLHLNDSQWVPRSGGCYGIQQSSWYACKCHFCEEHSNVMTPYVCERVCCHNSAAARWGQRMQTGSVGLQWSWSRHCQNRRLSCTCNAADLLSTLYSVLLPRVGGRFQATVFWYPSGELSRDFFLGLIFPGSTLPALKDFILSSI